MCCAKTVKSRFPKILTVDCCLQNPRRHEAVWFRSNRESDTAAISTFEQPITHRSRHRAVRRRLRHLQSRRPAERGRSCRDPGPRGGERNRLSRHRGELCRRGDVDRPSSAVGPQAAHRHQLPGVVDEAIAPRHIAATLAALATSLERMRVAQVYGVLIHQARDLAKSGWQYLVDALAEARARKGWTTRIGVSVYDESDLASGGKPLPARTSSSFLSTPSIGGSPFPAATRVQAARVEVHARSLFLQGAADATGSDIGLLRAGERRLKDLACALGRSATHACGGLFALCARSCRNQCGDRRR